MVNQMTFQQQLDKLTNEVEKVKEDISKLTYEGRKTRNELMKLKHSLTYRDMAGNCRLIQGISTDLNINL
jgi:peptidoglycan hydrolase CwlO-like protein